MKIKNKAVSDTQSTGSSEELLQVQCTEHWYIADPYVYLNFKIPDYRWPGIKESSEWKALCDLLYEKEEAKRVVKEADQLESIKNTLQSICGTLEHIDQLLANRTKPANISINIPDVCRADLIQNVLVAATSQ